MAGKMIRFGIGCLLVGTAIAWAAPWDDEANDFGNQQEYVENDLTQQPPTLASLKHQIERQNERIDGLTTLVEGLSASLMELQQAKSATSAGSDNSAEVLQKLAAMIDKINSDYVSKSELDRRLAGGAAGTSRSSSSSSNNVSAPSVQQETSLEGQPPATLYSEGVRAFGKRRYDDAKKRFIIADAKGYKPAAANYYLGEIAYYTQQYEDAIFYYKKSAGLYDKAEYIDVLLLHTAISLEKTGNKEQAKLFYQNIIDNYGGRKSAQIARENIKKL